MHGSHFITLDVDSCRNKQVTRWMILVSGTFSPNPVAFDSPVHLATHSHLVPRRTGTEDALPSKTDRLPRARQASPMAMPTCHAVLFSNSPRKHTQLFSLSHQIAGGQIKPKEPSFLPASPVTPTLADRDTRWSAAGSERAGEGTLPKPHGRKEQSTCCSSLTALAATEMPAGGGNS